MTCRTATEVRPAEASAFSLRKEVSPGSSTHPSREARAPALPVPFSEATDEKGSERSVCNRPRPACRRRTASVPVARSSTRKHAAPSFGCRHAATARRAYHARPESVLRMNGNRAAALSLQNGHDETFPPAPAAPVGLRESASPASGALPAFWRRSAVLRKNGCGQGRTARRFFRRRRTFPTTRGARTLPLICRSLCLCAAASASRTRREEPAAPSSSPAVRNRRKGLSPAPVRLCGPGSFFGRSQRSRL